MVVISGLQFTIIILSFIGIKLKIKWITVMTYIWFLFHVSFFLLFYSDVLGPTF